MAVTITQDVIQMTEEDDEVTIPLNVLSVRFVAEVGNNAADAIILTDPVTGGVLWRTYAGSTTGVEAQLMAAGRNRGAHWPNGAALTGLPADNGLVYIQYA